MKKIISIIILLTVISCNTFKHQQTKALEFFTAHPERGAQYCAQTFVEKDSMGKTDTVYQKANNKDYTSQIDSLNSLVDSLSNSYIVVTDSDCEQQYSSLVAAQKKLKQQLASFKALYKPCIPDTILLLDTAFKKDPGLLASVAYSNFQNDSLKTVIIKTTTELADSKKTSSTRFWVIIALSLVAASSIFLNFKKL